ncbi:MAG: hypothetical protein AAGA73_09280 [Pseudomonadota bacterium]
MPPKPLWLCLLVGLLACGCDQEATYELTGTTDERIVGIRRVIEDHGPVPSPIDDAHLIELQFGDNMLGPADFRSYIWIKVSPQHADKWKSVLAGSPDDPPIYDSPPNEPSWWLTSDEFERLQKYDTFPMFRRNGWVVIDDDGNIFVRNYTM